MQILLRFLFLSSFLMFRVHASSAEVLQAALEGKSNDSSKTGARAPALTMSLWLERRINRSQLSGPQDKSGRWLRFGPDSKSVRELRSSLQEEVHAKVAKVKQEATRLWCKKLDNAAKQIDFLKEQLNSERKHATKRWKMERGRLIVRAGRKEAQLQKEIEELRQTLENFKKAL